KHSGVLERAQGERHQAEQVKVGGAHSSPAAEEHVNADCQVDQPYDPLRLLQTPVQRFGNDHNRGFQGGSVAGGGVTGLAVDPGAVENAFQVRQLNNGVLGELFRGWNLVTPSGDW